MQKIVLSILALVGALSTLTAQVDPQLSQYMHQKLSYNPAYAGSVQFLEGVVAHRSQWTGLTSEQMSTQSLNVHMPLYSIKSGIGLHFINDFIGVQRSSTLMLDYAYQMKLGDGKLGIGVYGGMSQIGLKGELLRAPEGDYAADGTVISHNDDLLPITTENGFTYDVGMGLMYTADNYYVGASVTNLLEGSSSLLVSSSSVNAIFTRNYYLTAGYNWELSQSISVEPSILFRSDLTSHQLSTTAVAHFNNKLLAGISYRGYNKVSNDAVVMMFGFNIARNLRLSYSYDLGISKLNSFQNGSHEIVLIFKKAMKPAAGKGAIIYNPRYP